MNAPSPHSQPLLKACARRRKKNRNHRFTGARIRVHDLWHYQHRLIRKILAHTVTAALNI
jgi:hypothetical protein